MFGRYLSTEVMSSLIENPSLLELGGEQRDVTIMMTDLRGFTALSERLDPKEVVQMLNAYFEVMVETVLKYNGTINEIIGDALLVIFGAPQEMPDQTQRAIACAIEMQNAMAGVNRENRSKGLPDLEMGIGINKAEVIVGNIGSSKRSKYTVVGSGVNVTSRIESYTVGGQILISDAVFREVGDGLRIDGEQEVYPKGSETPLKIYDVGGIASPYNLVLETEDTDLVFLKRNIPILYSFLGGKHVRKERSRGMVMRLSRKGAEVAMDVSADLMTNLKMSLADVEDDLRSKDFYGKIIEGSDRGDNNYIIRFTSLPLEVASYFQAFRKHTMPEGLK
jgi:adenylate cyclase